MKYDKSKQTYGWDNLSKFLFLAGIFISIGKYSFLIGIPIVIYAFYRTRSKNFLKRASEQAAFDNLIRNVSKGIGSIFQGNTFNNLRNKFGGKFGNIFGPRRNSTSQGNNGTSHDKNYVIIICPKCGQRLRLPANKGNMEAKCPKCQSKIKTRT